MNQSSLKLWRERITDQRASGLKVTEWCEKNNLSKHAYYYWKKRIKCVEGDHSETTKVPVFAGLKPILRPMKEFENQLQISWKDLQISISTAEHARLAAEFIKQLHELC